MTYKNKDDITVHLGQKWLGVDGVERTLMKFAPIGIACFDTVAESVFLDDVPDFLHRLLFCPELGDLSDWWIVSEARKRGYTCPPSARYFAGQWVSNTPYNYWVRGAIYSVPVGTHWDQYRKTNTRKQLTETATLLKVQAMCEESLDPETFEKWETVKDVLQTTRGLKNDTEH